jgi:hypothetical protein
MTNRPVDYRRNWKGLVLDSDFVFGQDNEDVYNICLTERERQVLLSAVVPYAWVTRWYSPTSTALDLDGIQALIDGIILALLTECGEGSSMFKLRQNSDDPCLLEQSLDDGLTWSTAFNYSLCAGGGIGAAVNITLSNELIINTYISNYVDSPSDINENAPDDYFSDETDNRNMALCMALDAYVTSYCEEWRRKAEWTLLGALAALWLAAIPGIGWVAVVVAVGVAVGATYTTSVALNAVKDRDAVEDVICCAYEALQGAAINAANFEACLNNCSFTPGSNAAIVRDIVASDLDQQGNLLSFYDALGKAYLMAVAGAENCICDDQTWTYDLLGGDGQGALEGVSLYKDGYYSPLPNYNETYDFYAAYGVGNWRVGAVKLDPGVQWTLTGVSMTYDLDFNYASARGQWCLIDFNATGVESFLLQKSESSDIERTLEINGLFQTVRDLTFRWSSANATSPYARLTKIQIRGYGLNPFEEE